MSQATKLPGIKKIELSIRQMRPPANVDGTPPQLVGALEDGSPIYLGDVFMGNSAFAPTDAEGRSFSGHTQTPTKGPDGEDAYRLNKATGQKIIQIMKGKRIYEKRRYIMKDFGNGNAGMIPVPMQQKTNDLPTDLDRLNKALAENNMTLSAFIAALKGAVSEPDAVEASDEFPVADAKGPYYTLSNGERVKGKDAAVAAELALKPPGADGVNTD